MSRKPCQHTKTVRVVASIEGVPLTDSPHRIGLVCRRCHLTGRHTYFEIQAYDTLPVIPNAKFKALGEDPLTFASTYNVRHVEQRTAWSICCAMGKNHERNPFV